jgi:hypothetical protein
VVYPVLDAGRKWQTDKGFFQNRLLHGTRFADLSLKKEGQEPAVFVKANELNLTQRSRAKILVHISKQEIQASGKTVHADSISSCEKPRENYVAFSLPYFNSKRPDSKPHFLAMVPAL